MKRTLRGTSIGSDTRMVAVKMEDLRTLASMACEHVIWRRAKGTCFDRPAQGGCCNSCWARSMAEQYLAGVLDEAAPEWRKP